MSKEIKFIEPEHIEDRLYREGNGWCIIITVYHPLNEIAAVDVHDIDKAICYLQKIKEQIIKNY
jgi:hypothetical protein